MITFFAMIGLAVGWAVCLFCLLQAGVLIFGSLLLGESGAMFFALVPLTISCGLGYLLVKYSPLSVHLSTIVSS